MRASPTPSPTESPQARHTLPKPARGHGMTRRADRYFVQETLRNINLQDGPPRPGTLLKESHPVTPEAGQYDSPDEDDPEEDLTSQANFDSEDEYTDAMGRSGRILPAECREGTCQTQFLSRWFNTGLEAGFFLCLGSPTETTAFAIETGGQRWKLPWPRATSLKESRSPCSRL